MAKTHDVVYIFIDTNLFLHYKDLQQIDWCKEFDSKRVVLIAALVMIAELDRHKDTDRRKRIRDRCSAATKMISSAAKSGSHHVRDDVTLECWVKSYQDFEQYGLDRGRDDHKVILAARHFSDEEKPGSRVVYLSKDTNARIAAEHLCKIEAFEPLDVWRLPRLEDDSDRKIRQLEEQISALNAEKSQILNAQPSIICRFSGGFTHIEKKLPPVPVGTADQFLRAEREKWQSELELNSPAPGSKWQPRSLKYKEEIEIYLNALSAWFSIWLENAQRAARSIAIEFTAYNTGELNGKDVRIKLQFIGDGFSLASELPKEPVQPPQPGSDTMIDTLSYWSAQESPLHQLSKASNPSQPRINILPEGKSVLIEIPLLKHRSDKALPPIYLTLDNRTQAGCVVVVGEASCEGMSRTDKVEFMISIDNSSGTCPVRHYQLLHK